MAGSGSVSGAGAVKNAAWSAYAETNDAAAAVDSVSGSAAAIDAIAPEIAYEEASGGYAHFLEGGSRTAQQVYYPEDDVYRPMPQAGVLTAGRIKDNKDWTSFSEALERDDWAAYQRVWELTPKDRLEVYVTAGETRLPGCSVPALDGRGQTLWQAVTDSSGKGYLFLAMFSTQSEPAEIVAQYGERTESARIAGGTSSLQKTTQIRGDNSESGSALAEALRS